MATEQLTMARPAGLNLRPLLMLIGIAGAVAAGVAVMLWWQGPNWSLLYGNLSASDASQVTQSLQTAGIKYKFGNSDGSIMVPAENVHDARLKLAAQGLPESSASGLDLINKDNGIGVSQFMESARYQYALETELGRTISALKSVESARVHLAMSEQSAFVRDRRPASASVLVQLRQGGRLEAEQVQAIVHLVASSIPELQPEQVTVVDQQGHLLSSAGSSQATATAEHFEAAHRIEDTYVERIEQLLVPLVGAGRVRAQVTVDLDPGDSEESHEQYKPESAVVRSEQTSEETSHGGSAQAGGVPGALTNQPPAGGVAQPAPVAAKPATPAAGATPGAAKNGAAATPAVAAAPVEPENVSKQETRNFEIDRTLSYERHPGGRIKRLTAAVLLDNVRKSAAGGKETSEPISAAQIEDITRLVKNVVGYDESRGDSVNVVNEAFHEEPQSLAPEPVPLWQRPGLQEGVRLGLGALILLAIGLGVLRPMIKNLTTPPPQLVDARVASEGAGAGPQGSLGVASAGPATTGQALAFEQQIVQAKGLVAQDPKRVAQVVKNWVGDQ
jgi:flagellar M-ring protein FliF